MRILIKGGVWKNAEDEVLKAAVMKYGKSQWARVSSLLNRKSASQCKARWYEWLDPSIKKTDWNREEEEKLLHLAKLMPNQWRTIAPIVGRTASQCMEHYEYLLDIAANATSSSSSSSSSAGIDDPRKLRPGEIDPTPETKPARPDPIDMDEDEKEMLSEARARLANTRGKKAKRKARERQLEESRKLSLLQKSRELKAAGIETSGGNTKKRKLLQLQAKEIPFQKTTPAGFYDVTAENVLGQRMHLDPKSQGLEINRMEGKAAKENAERESMQDKKRLKTLFKANAALAIMKVNELSDPASIRRRSSLSLPKPQVSDSELEEIVRMGQLHEMMPPPIGYGTKKASAATQSLVGDYTSAIKMVSTAASLSISRTPQQEDIIMQEAHNLRTLRDITPLLGAEIPELYNGTGFEGSTARSAVRATPNSILTATPASTYGGNTPGSVFSSSSVASSVRDQFGLNSNQSFDMMSDTASVASSSYVGSSSSSLSHFNRLNVMNQLKSLPEPEYTYEVSIAAVPEEIEVDTVGNSKPMDAAEIEEMEIKRRQVQEEYELSKRSTVIQRALPRPTTSIASAAALMKGTVVDDNVSTLIYDEMIQMIEYDNYRYPTGSSSNISSSFSASSVQLEEIDADLIQSARDEVDREYNKAVDSHQSQEHFNRLWDLVHKDTAATTTTTDPEVLRKLVSEFNEVKGRIEKSAQKSSKLEGKLSVTSKGYIDRNNKLTATLVDAYNDFNKANIDLMSFSTLHEQEKITLAQRLDQYRNEMLYAQQQESLLQHKYSLRFNK